MKKGWTTKQLKHTCHINRNTLHEKTPNDWQILYLDISAVDSQGNIGITESFTFGQAPSRARRKVDHGDTIISTVRTYLKAIAYIAHPSDNLIASTGFAVLSPHKEMAPRFLWRVVQDHRFVSDVMAYSEGVGYPAIAPSRLASLKISFPNYKEQNRIASYLDEQTAKIDRLMDMRRRQIVLLQEQRAALIQQAVTRGLNPHVPMKDSSIPWLGEMPLHWRLAPVNIRYEVQLGKMLDTSQIKGFHLAPYLRNVDVQWDRINISNLPLMDFSPRDQVKFSLRSGDLLVCEGGEIGRAAIWNDDLPNCFYQKAIHRLRPRSSSDNPRFMFYLLLIASKRGVFSSQGGQATIEHLPAEALRRYRFPFAPRKEQDHIVEFVDSQVVKFSNIEDAYTRQLTLLAEYRAALIHECVTGQREVPDMPAPLVEKAHAL